MINKVQGTRISQRSYVAVFVGSTNTTNNIVNNPEFQSFVKVVDSRYLIPGRMLLNKKMD